MSTGPVTPKTEPIIQPWMNTLLGLAVAAYTAYVHASIQVVVPTPDVKPAPVVDPHGLTITDRHGNTITDTVDAGHQFTIDGSAGTTLTPIPSVADDADITEVSDSRLICTMRNGCKLQIVVTGAGKPSVIAVTCNHAPNPPPVDPVKPVVDPTPKPSGAVRVVIFKDALGKALTKDQVAAIGSTKMKALLDERCAKDAAGLPAWHVWDKDITPPDAWAKLVTATRSEIASKNLDFPILAIEVGNTLHLYEITNETAVLNTLNSVFGEAT